MRSLRLRLPSSIAIASLACAALLAACGAPGARNVEEPVRISLAERLADADLDPAIVRIEPDAPETGSLFSTGWHPVVGRPPLRWTASASALVEIPIVRPAEARLQLALTSVNAPGAIGFELVPQLLEEQRVQLSWNGVDLGTHELGPYERVVVVALPADIQHPGRNWLEIRPSYWLPSQESLGLETAAVGVGLAWIELHPQSALRAAPRPAALAHADDFVQRCSSVLGYSFVLPERPVLRGTVRLRAQGEDADPQPAASVEIGILDTRGRSTPLFELAQEPGVEPELVALDADLSSWAGELVSIQVACTTPSEREPAQRWTVEWRDLHVAGFETRPSPTPVPSSEDPANLLVLLVDTLRADAADETPVIGRLAREGALFTHARSNASWTRTSVASLFTSLDPAAHGVLENTSGLPEGVPYLPELLQQRGYRTYGLSRNVMVHGRNGLQRGFDEFRFEAPQDGADPAELAERTWKERLLPFIAARGDAPFFVYLHDLDPHSPYVPPAGYARAPEELYAGRISGGGPLTAVARRAPELLGPGDRRELRALYDAEARAVGTYLDALLDRLAEAGLDEDTLVVLVSDHGEEFFEHGRQGHGHTLYEELLHVPLVMRLPGRIAPGTRIAQPVSLDDVPRTVLELLGFEPPAELEGRSLVPLLRGSATVSEEVSVAASINGLRALVRARPGEHWKLVRSEAGGERGAGVAQYQLFDLLEDPAEDYNLFATRPVVSSGMRQMLRAREREARAWASRRGRAVEAELSPETLDRMRALGYVE